MASAKQDVNTNVDLAEVRKFDELASRWWDPDGEFKPLHKLNPIRLDYVAQRTRLENRQVLDVGCGGGILAESLVHQGAIVTGIDMAPGPLSVARIHQKKSRLQNLNYLESSAESLAEDRPGCFDAVTCMEVIEHVPDPASLVNACRRLVKPGGDVFFSTINRNPKAFLLAIVGAEYVMRMLPRGTHEYARFIKPSELRSWGLQAGLEFGDAAGIEYAPFTDQFRLSDNLDVNYLMHFSVPA